MKPGAGNITTFKEALSIEGDVVLLESQKSDHPESKKTYLAANPKAWIKAWGNDIEIFEDGKTHIRSGDIWSALAEFRERNRGWLFGYLGYDLKNSLETLSSNNKRLTESPDMYFMVPGDVKEVFDGDALNSVEELDFYLVEKERVAKEEYLSKIIAAQSRIKEGDFYEVNLSHALQFHFSGNPAELYQAMKSNGPVPFGAFIRFDDLSICSSSPERFLSRRGNTVISQPIKGTLSRNGAGDEEKSLLLHSEKNRAENLMIVDLVRNDLSRIAEKDSVKVSNLFEIQSFETVHQMVSTVECTVSSQIDSIEIIKACFPMGSMTGAPKISAMSGIEELEDYKRGIYSGAIGYIKPDGDFDFNVVIRTAIIQKNVLVFPVGGAITSDSDPEEEWEETLVKARALTSLIPNYKNE